VREHSINEDIQADPVRLVDPDNADNNRVMSLREALTLSEEAGVDLVEITAQADPPVVRIMDYGKFLFEREKQKSAAKKKQKQVEIKELKFRPGTAEGDYQVKMRNLMKFLEQGNKVKVTIRYRGREMAHTELGKELLDRIETDVQELGKVEQYPKLEGRQMVMVIGPQAKKK
jgi:translation initiation factor IF-3